MDFEKLISKGNRADIYLCEKKIIKLFKDSLHESEAEYEANKQSFAYSKGLPVPRIYEVTKINGRQAIIMEYIAGKTIGNLLFDDMTNAEQYMNLSVDIQLKIHDVKADRFELMADKLERNLRSASALSENQRNYLVERVHCMQLDKRLCHGDYHIFNLIQNENGVAIIDWVDSSAGSVNADIYRTYLLYSEYSMELASMYLRMYCDKSGLHQDDIFAWASIISGARLSENVGSEKESRLLETVARCCPLQSEQEKNNVR